MEQIELNDSALNCAKSFENRINSVSDGMEIKVTSNKLYFSDRAVIRNKKNLVIDGGNCLIVSHFDATVGFIGYSGLFHFENCENIKFKNFRIDTDNDVNTVGIVKEIDYDTKKVTVEILSDCTFPHGAQIFATNSMDAQGSADYILYSESPSSYEQIDGKTVVIRYGEELQGDLRKLTRNHRICMRFGLGGYKVLQNAMLIFENCKNFTVENINIYSSPGYATVLFPRCENFVFRRYCVCLPKDSSRLMSSNVDGLHVFGITGSLKLVDCFFEGLGDDALNIHSTAGMVGKRFSENEIQIFNARFGCNLETQWCRESDKIAVYDSDFNRKGTVSVVSYSADRLTYRLIDGSIAEGDIIGNTAFYAKTTVKRCRILNSRARALLFQTEHIDVSNCYFYGISLPAILISPDIKRWFEVGPSDDVVIRNNIFRKCNFSNPVTDTAVVTARDCHDGYSLGKKAIHGSITVKNNLFINCKRIFSFRSVGKLKTVGNRVKK